MNTTPRFLVLAGVAATSAFFAGCASEGVQNPSGVPVTEMKADERGFVAGTGVESQDLVAVTDKMARSILGIPEIARATTAPTIVIDPVVNETRFPINKSLFTDRIRVLLNSRATGRVSFLARERMAALERERQLKQSGQVTSTYDPAPVAFARWNAIPVRDGLPLAPRTTAPVPSVVTTSAGGRSIGYRSSSSSRWLHLLDRLASDVTAPL